MKYIIQSDRVINGSGMKPMRNGVVVTQGTEIAKVCTYDQLTQADKDNAEILSIPGGSILPGFIEMHSHIHCSSETDAYEHITT